MEDPLSGRRGLVTVASDANLISALVGSSAAVGSPSNRIIPWAIGSNAGTNAVATGSLGNTFVSYGTDGGFANGFRALAATEYENAGVLVAAGAVTAANNVRYSGITNLTLTGTGHTVNALLVDNANAATSSYQVLSGSGAGDSLAIASGAILFTSSNAALRLRFRYYHRNGRVCPDPE
jgi:hypothetical protein